ncbi:MAG: methyltransferase RsmF C-terminal domain-like protein [Christensenellales bacterium]|jgi:16S rRNA C967 or C1407 C5-methylase (RsmB/RsmF family)/NOL1/NOP2/fmu family ribosome biogenesis protein
MNPAFARQMQALLGPEAAAFWAGMDAPRWRALRLNPLKKGALELTLPWATRPVPWEPYGRVLLEEDARPGRSLLHHAGAFYLQEPSAMAPAGALAARPGERILDLCAAPGGKTGQLAAAMGGRGLLLANDPAPARAKELCRNLERLCVPHAVVTCALPGQLAPYLEGYFDGILVDAPCSGEGMMRRDETARAQWSPELVAQCAARQREVLGAAARMLRPGGRMVYSTCTFNRQENEGQIEAFLAEHPEFSLEALPELPGVDRGVGLPEAWRLWPHHLEGEGHFVCKLVKAGPVPAGRAEPDRRWSADERGGSDRRRDAGERGGVLAQARRWVETFVPDLAGALVQQGEAVRLTPEGPQLGRLPVLMRGLLVGAAQGRQLRPAHHLALAASAGPVIPLSEEQAMAYWRGEELPAPAGAPEGFAPASFQGLTLGWVKHAGGRLKNHLPKGLRRVGGA